jgi:carboxylesterase
MDVFTNVITGNIQMRAEDGHYRKLNKVGALLVHGLNGNPRDMEELTGFLTSYNIVALNVLLPSRGAHMHGMLPLDWPGWSTAVYRGLQKLRQSCKYVFLIGHSLGGALCLHVAASERVAGVVTMCAPIYIYPWMFPTAHPTKQFNPVSPKLREGLLGYGGLRRPKPDLYTRSQRGPAENALHYLPSLRAELPAVTAPALIMAAIHDYVVPARDAQAIYRLIGSQEKYLVKFRRSYHLLMKDHDQEEVFGRTLDFIQNYAH